MKNIITWHSRSCKKISLFSLVWLLHVIQYDYITHTLYLALKYFLSPLSANIGYIRHDTVVTLDSCNSGHCENYENIFWHFRVRAKNFLQNGIQIFIFWLIHSWEIAFSFSLHFRYFFRKAKKVLTKVYKGLTKIFPIAKTFRFTPKNVLKEGKY